MSKDQRPPSATAFRAERLPMQYKAMGIEDNPLPFLYGLEEKLEEMAANIWSEPRISSSHKELRQFVAALEKLQKRWRQLAPMHRSIDEAGFLRKNPHADKDDFANMVDDIGPRYVFDNLSPMLENLTQNIEFLIDRTGDYRKRLMTKHVIEPFLDIMNDLGVVPSKKLPRSRMFLALFDVLGLEPRGRVTDVTVRNAVRRLNTQRQTSV